MILWKEETNEYQILSPLRLIPLDLYLQSLFQMARCVHGTVLLRSEAPLICLLAGYFINELTGEPYN